MPPLRLAGRQPRRCSCLHPVPYRAWPAALQTWLGVLQCLWLDVPARRVNTFPTTNELWNGATYCAIFQLGLVENGIGRWQLWWVFVPYRCAMREHEPGARNSEI